MIIYNVFNKIKKCYHKYIDNHIYEVINNGCSKILNRMLKIEFSVVIKKYKSINKNIGEKRYEI